MPAKRKTRSTAASSSKSQKLKQIDRRRAEEEAAKIMERPVEDSDGSEPKFIGPPFKDDDARKRWPKKYQGKVKFLLSFLDFGVLFGFSENLGNLSAF